MKCRTCGNEIFDKKRGDVKRLREIYDVDQVLLQWVEIVDRVEHGYECTIFPAPNPLQMHVRYESAWPSPVSQFKTVTRDGEDVPELESGGEA